jgi:hypothetical protein
METMIIGILSFALGWFLSLDYTTSGKKEEKK